MAGQNISVRMENEKLAEIDLIAKAQDRSRNYVVNEALDRYLDEERQWLAKVKAGLSAAVAGDFASDEEVNVLFEGFEDKAR